MSEKKEIVVLPKITKFSDGLEAWAEGVVIDSDEKNGEVADTLTRVKRAIRDGKAELKDMLEDFKNGMKKIKDRYDVPLIPLEKVKDILNTKQIEFARAKVDKERAEQAVRDVAEKARLAGIEKTKQELAAKGIDVNLPEAIKEEPKEEPKSIKTSGMYSSSSVRFIPKFRCVDISKVPVEYLLFNEKKANQDAKCGLRVLAGCEWHDDEASNTSRG